MSREYFVRGPRKTVEEINNVVAIKVIPRTSEAWRAPELAPSGRRPGGRRRPARRRLEAFANARWVFVEPSPETFRAIAAREPIVNAEDVGKLVQRSSGRPAIRSRLPTAMARGRSPMAPRPTSFPIGRTNPASACSMVIFPWALAPQATHELSR